MFCSRCGTKIPDEYSFCANCGAPVSPNNSSQQTVNTNSAGTYKLTIVRENQFYAINPPVKININGVRFLSIDNGASLTLDLPEGHYRIEFSCHVRHTYVELEMHSDMLINIRWNRITGKLEAKVQGAVLR